MDEIDDVDDIIQIAKVPERSFWNIIKKENRKTKWSPTETILSQAGIAALASNEENKDALESLRKRVQTGRVKGGRFKFSDSRWRVKEGPRLHEIQHIHIVNLVLGVIKIYWLDQDDTTPDPTRPQSPMSPVISRAHTPYSPVYSRPQSPVVFVQAVVPPPPLMTASPSAQLAQSAPAPLPVLKTISSRALLPLSFVQPPSLAIGRTSSTFAMFTPSDPLTPLPVLKTPPTSLHSGPSTFMMNGEASQGPTTRTEDPQEPMDLEKSLPAGSQHSERLSFAEPTIPSRASSPASFVPQPSLARTSLRSGPSTSMMDGEASQGPSTQAEEPQEHRDFGEPIPAGSQHLHPSNLAEPTNNYSLSAETSQNVPHLIDPRDLPVEQEYEIEDTAHSVPGPSLPAPTNNFSFPNIQVLPVALRPGFERVGSVPLMDRIVVLPGDVDPFFVLQRDYRDPVPFEPEEPMQQMLPPEPRPEVPPEEQVNEMKEEIKEEQPFYITLD